MKLGRLNHVGVVVPDLDTAIRRYRDVIGARSIGAPFLVESQQVRGCFIGMSDSGGTECEIELLTPIAATSPVARWLARNPAGGQHHLCFEVPDIGMAQAWFAGQDKRVLGPPRIGAHGTPVLFVHPADMGGVLTELMESPRIP